jgi:hypothetical protein
LEVSLRLPRGIFAPEWLKRNYTPRYLCVHLKCCLLWLYPFKKQNLRQHIISAFFHFKKRPTLHP